MLWNALVEARKPGTRIGQALSAIPLVFLVGLAGLIGISVVMSAVLARSGLASAYFVAACALILVVLSTAAIVPATIWLRMAFRAYSQERLQSGAFARRATTAATLRFHAIQAGIAGILFAVVSGFGFVMPGHAFQAAVVVVPLMLGVFVLRDVITGTGLRDALLERLVPMVAILSRPPLSFHEGWTGSGRIRLARRASVQGAESDRTATAFLDLMDGGGRLRPRLAQSGPTLRQEVILRSVALTAHWRTGLMISALAFWVAWALPDAWLPRIPMPNAILNWLQTPPPDTMDDAQKSHQHDVSGGGANNDGGAGSGGGDSGGGSQGSNGGSGDGGAPNDSSGAGGSSGSSGSSGQGAGPGAASGQQAGGSAAGGSGGGAAGKTGQAGAGAPGAGSGNGAGTAGAPGQGDGAAKAGQSGSLGQSAAAGAAGVDGSGQGKGAGQSGASADAPEQKAGAGGTSGDGAAQGHGTGRGAATPGGAGSGRAQGDAGNAKSSGQRASVGTGGQQAGQSGAGDGPGVGGEQTGKSDGGTMPESGSSEKGGAVPSSASNDSIGTDQTSAPGKGNTEDPDAAQLATPAIPGSDGAGALNLGTTGPLFAEPGSAPETVEAHLPPEAALPDNLAVGPMPKQTLPAWIKGLLQ